jgi:uncharacterized protein YndB with AHSA1/START domain
MKRKGLTAHASITINAPLEKVWDALVNPILIKKYMFGTNVTSKWKEGSPIIWKGEWQGKVYEDKGIILRLQQKHLLQYSHFSPLSDLPDKPENYHTVTITLSDQNTGVSVSLFQDNNPTKQTLEHSEKNWRDMLVRLKKQVETVE